jgi:uncharacterized membrane protein YdfJ with MMPL/SSD domain
VTGATAASYDKNQLMKQTAPIVFGFVPTLIFPLLRVSFRSMVIAARAIVLNLLSVGAGYGIMVAIFQYGWGEHILNFQSNGGITRWLPIFMFVILFGLSTDYQVHPQPSPGSLRPRPIHQAGRRARHHSSKRSS